MDDVNIYIGRQRGVGVTDTFRACVLHSEQQAESFPLHKCLKLQCLDRWYKERLPAQSGTPPSSLCLPR